MRSSARPVFVRAPGWLAPPAKALALAGTLAIVVPLFTAPLSAEQPSAPPKPLVAGDKIPTLTVGHTTYREVEVRSVNARTAVITHAGGMTSLRLRDLSPEWQQRFAYDAERERAAEAAERARAASSARPSPPLPGRPFAERTPLTVDRIVQFFGRPAVLEPHVDLRPKFFQLELSVKNQGRRPSCAVFAVVSALELLNAEAAGRAEKFSEEYLIWATRKTLQRSAGPTPSATEATAEDADEGFSLLEVVFALRGYGVPLQSAMPNTFGRRMDEVREPPESVIAQARAHERVFIHVIPGRDNATRLTNIVHALNAQVPVPVGMAWPHYRSLRTGYLSQQEPMTDAGHAVTLVGYVAPSSRIEDVQFLFKNSWGARWGQGGYGVVTYAYLLRHLQSAVLLEVQPPKS